MMSSYELFKVSGIKKRTVLHNYSMLAPYSIVFTAHSSLQKRAIHKCVYCDNDSTLNLVHTSDGNTPELRRSGKTH